MNTARRLPGPAPTRHRHEHLVPSGASIAFSTWSYWGRTTLRLKNSGSGAAQVDLVSGDGLLESFTLGPGEEWTMAGTWGGRRIGVLNRSPEPSTLLASVW